ncbi:MAG TPA: hypothetical protein VMM54_00645 [Nitrospirota bacterium]|nr:hypothetical protein [Nitrospirota bacterium]
MFLVGLQRYLISRANKEREQKLKLFDLIVTSEDNRYSLSRFQIYVWTVWVVIAFAQAAFATLTFPIVPENLAILMAINGTTTVISTALTDIEKLKLAKPAEQPVFFSDIFLDASGTLDLPRTQMFIWTMVILVTHMVIFWKGCLAGRPSLPEISGGMLILMGVSQGIYLGVKAAHEKKTSLR